eukprot:TRINITY_DN76296_c0_g1_i1.p2 TRINITY_DN76296_c0_g1~~TRINITY_DN76296_c0_g1_i1.p2  ORF type:complete len:212 (-),score=24.43 TRINITY_DN76296_c0_g1_i1:121-756(-)
MIGTALSRARRRIECCQAYCVVGYAVLMTVQQPGRLGGVAAQSDLDGLGDLFNVGGSSTTTTEGNTTTSTSSTASTATTSTSTTTGEFIDLTLLEDCPDIACVRSFVCRDGCESGVLCRCLGEAAAGQVCCAVDACHPKFQNEQTTSPPFYLPTPPPVGCDGRLGSGNSFQAANANGATRRHWMAAPLHCIVLPLVAAAAAAGIHTGHMER